nr:Ig-like domain-containing protein [Bacteroides intestinalis]
MRTKLDFLLWICFFVLFVACEDHPQEPDIVAVTSVTLNESALSLKEGRNVTLSATITPDDATNQNVTWKSSDPDIATVDTNGKIRALKPGTATITVITEDGGKTAICTVTVEPGDPLKSSRTVLVYVAADNTLSGFALLDFEEMKVGMAKVEDVDVNFLVYIDKGGSPQLLELKNENGTVVEKVVKTYSSRNSVGVSETTIAKSKNSRPKNKMCH